MFDLAKVIVLPPEPANGLKEYVERISRRKQRQAGGKSSKGLHKGSSGQLPRTRAKWYSNSKGNEMGSFLFDRERFSHPLDTPIRSLAEVRLLGGRVFVVAADLEARKKNKKPKGEKKVVRNFRKSSKSLRKNQHWFFWNTGAVQICAAPFFIIYCQFCLECYNPINY